MTEMAHGTIVLQDRDPVLPRWWRTVDRWSLVFILALFGVGLLLGLAASPPLAARNDQPAFYYVQRQAIFGGLGLVAMLILSMFSPVTVRRLGIVGFLVMLVALLLLPFLGTDYGKGAVRWYSLGFGSFQPSEFLKPGFAIVTGWLLAASMQIGGPPGRAWSLALTGLIVIVLVMQPDFGQAVLVLFGWAVMYFVGGASPRLLVGVAGLVVAGGMAAYAHSEHFARRIDGFLDTDVDPTTQIGYAINAIREGGFLGVGVGAGRVKWSLPDAHTDFIIAVAAEEYGLLLVLAVIALYLGIALRSLVRLTRERDPFIRIAGTGLVAMFAVQAMVNMGVAVRLLPAKGMTLPFISYGGSSMIATGIAMGFLLALTRRRPQGELGELWKAGRR